MGDCLVSLRSRLKNNRFDLLVVPTVYPKVALKTEFKRKASESLFRPQKFIITAPVRRALQTKKGLLQKSFSTKDCSFFHKGQSAADL